tara:strand:+ start:694 stop:1257 length:564 start_codon:yes stop_codon:yes gene_type:complete
MFAHKKKCYLFLESINLLNLNLIKQKNKYIIIYRNNNLAEDINLLKKYRDNCRIKSIAFYVANDLNLAIRIKADGLYLSSFNKKYINNSRLDLIGSAHNFAEINEKIKQGCSSIIFSRLFKTNYKNKIDFFGVIKFNLIARLFSIEFVPLGGIRKNNLNKLKIVHSKSLAILSEIKKKPTKIISRLF